jgi:hypothetical protein
MKQIFCMALILFGAVGVFAQERTISKTEFDAAIKSPNATAPFVWKGRTWRMIITTETKAQGKVLVDFSTKSTTEFIPYGISRSINENRQGSKITKSEKITIKDKIYKRDENGQWTVESLTEKPKQETASNTPPPPAAAPATNSKFESQTEYKYLGTEKLNNQTANVYVMITKNKNTDSSTGLERKATYTQKYWLSEDGTILKNEKISDGRSTVDSFYNRLVMIYELDPNIKIEVPVIN